MKKNKWSLYIGILWSLTGLINIASAFVGDFDWTIASIAAVNLAIGHIYATAYFEK